MSFSVWTTKPPFAEEDLVAGEKIYRVGERWVVTDQGAPTAAQVDLVLGLDLASGIKAQLAAIDAKTGSVRWLRELALAFGDLTKQLHDAGIAGVPDTSLNSGMVKVRAIEEQCIALRQQLAPR